MKPNHVYVIPPNAMMSFANQTLKLTPRKKMSGPQVSVDEIRTHEGKLAAQTVVRMEYRAPDVKTFEKTAEKGSGIVRRLVFDGLMESESDSSTGKQQQDSALTPANYEFHISGPVDLGPYHCFVLGVTLPSFWINQADFVREYRKVDDFWLPLRDETQVDVKIYGKRVLTIEHGPYVFRADTQRAADSVN